MWMIVNIGETQSLDRRFRAIVLHCWIVEMERFGKYILVDKISSGGMADVYRAKVVGIRGFTKTVAIKRIHSHLLERTRFLRMFTDEAKIASRLVHPNIVQIFDLGEDGGMPYIAMEHLEGDDLETVVHIIDKSDDVMMGVMAGLEFGIVDTERRSPYFAAFASAGLFLAGSHPSVLPFAFFENTGTGLFVAAILTGIGLLAVGAAKTVMTRTSPFASAFENLAIGFAGGLLSYLVGLAFDALIS